MIEIKPSDSTPDKPWPDSDQRLRVADTSMLPGSEKAPAPAVDLLNHAVRGAHNSIDRLAESVAPTVQRLGEGVSAAEDALHAKTELCASPRTNGSTVFAPRCAATRWHAWLPPSRWAP